MADQNNRTTLLPISGVLMLLATLGVVMYTQSPFKVSRPTVEATSEAVDKVPARLWQDPFLAVLDYESAKKNKYDEPNTNVNKLYADLKKEIKSKLTKDPLTIMGVMVNGGSYSEDGEWRMRTRYAVLAGLERLGFVPEDSSHIEYITFDPRPKKVTSLALYNIVPYEWLISGVDHDTKRNVLVFWINDDAFQADEVLKTQVINNIISLFDAALQGEKQNKIDYKILGPATSTNLVSMMKELNNGSPVDEKDKTDIEIFSAVATADNVEVAKATNIKEKVLSSMGKRRLKTKIISLERTIGTDDKLAEKIIDELCLRNVNKNALECNGRGNEHNDHIVLISEWDTFYGQSLPSSFGRVWGNKAKDDKHEWIHRFSYLRGLDGMVPEAQGKSKDHANENDDKKDPQKDDIYNLEQPTGKSQYDYLRRLPVTMSLLEKELKRCNKDARIKAIGVLGSDFYDKYLVLQALRQRLPDAIYFTTDLDARMTHPDNYKWMRNVIVASNYDLQLYWPIQGEIPPFRDNYQTSVFLTTLRALGQDKYYDVDSQIKLNLPEGDIIYRTTGPRIFEIGRNRALDLTEENWNTGCRYSFDKSSEPLPLHPYRYQSDSIIFKPKGLLAVAIIVILLLLSASSIKFRQLVISFVNTMRNHKYMTAFIIIALTIFIVYFAPIVNDPREEPFSCRGGISIWPSAIIRLAALSLSLYFVNKISNKLRDSNKDLADEYCLHNDSGTEVVQSNRKTVKYWWDMLRHMYDWPYGKLEEKTARVDGVWNEYMGHSIGCVQHTRLFILMFLFIILSIVISFLFGGPVSPVRGPKSALLEFIILCSAVLMFLYLTFLVVDETGTCRWFIGKAVKGDVEWLDVPDNTSGQVKGEWLLIHLIAKRTDVVGRFIFYPFIIWAMMLFARSDYFDDFTTPWQLVLIISLTAVYAWSCAVMLRGAAEQARTKVLDRLSIQLEAALSLKSPNQELVKQIEYVIKEVQDIRRGAFSPFMQQPVVQALLVPFSGAGGMYLIEFLDKLNL